MSEQHYDRLFKIVVIGESCVGKTALISKFMNKNVKTEHITTIGIDFNAQFLKVGNTMCKLHLWDTAGLERFRIITKQYYRGADGIIFVYDVLNEKSLDQLNFWFDDVIRVMPLDMPYLVVGNKSDCIKGPSFTKKGVAFASERGIPFVLTSAKNGDNVEVAFIEITKLMIEHKKKQFGLETCDVGSGFGSGSGSESKSKKIDEEVGCDKCVII